VKGGRSGVKGKVKAGEERGREGESMEWHQMVMQKK